jgi:hypothetical protein
MWKDRKTDKEIDRKITTLCFFIYISCKYAEYKKVNKKVNFPVEVLQSKHCEP